MKYPSISNAGTPFGGFQVDLLLNLDVSLTFPCLLFPKYHLHLILLLKPEMSLHKSTLLIEKSFTDSFNLFCKTFDF